MARPAKLTKFKCLYGYKDPSKHFALKGGIRKNGFYLGERIRDGHGRHQVIIYGKPFVRRGNCDIGWESFRFREAI